MLSRFLFPLLLSLVAAAASAETWHAERLTSGSGPPRVERLWSKGAWFRAEIVYGGHPLLTYVKGDRYVMVDAATGKGVSIQRSPKSIAADASRGRPFGNEQQLLEKLGGEKVKADAPEAACDLYRLTDQSGRREICVSTGAEKLPLYTKAWDRESGNESETRYLGWEKALDLSDDFFSPDPRIQLESVTYEAYAAKPSGPAPAMYPELLHGR